MSRTLLRDHHQVTPLSEDFATVSPAQSQAVPSVAAAIAVWPGAATGTQAVVSTEWFVLT